MFSLQSPISHLRDHSSAQSLPTDSRRINLGCGIVGSLNIDGSNSIAYNLIRLQYSLHMVAWCHSLSKPLYIDVFPHNFYTLNQSNTCTCFLCFCWCWHQKFKAPFILLAGFSMASWHLSTVRHAPGAHLLHRRALGREQVLHRRLRRLLSQLQDPVARWPEKMLWTWGKTVRVGLGCGFCK